MSPEWLAYATPVSVIGAGVVLYWRVAVRFGALLERFDSMREEFDGTKIELVAQGKAIARIEGRMNGPA